MKYTVAHSFWGLEAYYALFSGALGACNNCARACFVDISTVRIALILLFISTDSQCSQECDPDAKCTEHLGSWQCVCNPGFKSSGLSCERKSDRMIHAGFVLLIFMSSSFIIL